MGVIPAEGVAIDVKDFHWIVAFRIPGAGVETVLLLKTPDGDGLFSFSFAAFCGLLDNSLNCSEISLAEYYSGALTVGSPFRYPSEARNLSAARTVSTYSLPLLRP